MGVKLLAAFLLFAPGCFWVTTKQEGEEMQDRIKTIEDNSAAQTKGYEERSKKLDESLDQATKLLTRNNADLGTQVDKMSDEIAQLSGKVELLQRNIDVLKNTDIAAQLTAINARLDVLEAQLGIGKGGGTASTSLPVNVDKATLWDQANQKLQASQYPEAIRMFRVYVANFPKDDKADNAQYLIGEALYKQKDYEHAIAEFQHVIDTFPNGDVVDDAFMEAGTAALENRWCVDAGAYFGELVRRFPSSPFAKTARAKLEFISKHKKDTKVCKSG